MCYNIGPMSKESKCQKIREGNHNTTSLKNRNPYYDKHIRKKNKSKLDKVKGLARWRVRIK